MRPLHAVLAGFLICFSGWTLSAHACVLMGWNLQTLIGMALASIIVLLAAYCRLSAARIPYSRNPASVSLLASSGRPDSVAMTIRIVVLTLLPALLHWSWLAFWSASTVLLIDTLIRNDAERASEDDWREAKRKSPSQWAAIAAIVALLVLLALLVSRSDMDDAFYGAIAASAASDPGGPLLAGDPMLGEPGLPLIFPSYRFSSFELLSGAIAHLLSVPAMQVYYVDLLPVWVVLAVVVTFLLANELIPHHWLMAGALTVALVLVLGEMPRSPANFSFVRLFQGKAVLLSVVLPAIFYLTSRSMSPRGTRRDLFLLACCQITAIGLSNFGMLAAPIATGGALIATGPATSRVEWRKPGLVALASLIALPYLIDVALQGSASPLMRMAVESPETVWTSVFGQHQQYLVATLLLAGPVLARDRTTRWALGVPPLLLLGVYLNPLLSTSIALYVTSPPVYWRVVWSMPVLGFMAISICMVVFGLRSGRTHRLASSALLAVVGGLFLYALPFNTMRSDNTGPLEGFAELKIPPTHLRVARLAMAADRDGGRLLAPEEIAGVVSRFEGHPKLIATRAGYLDLIAPAIGDEQFHSRRVLYDFANRAAQVEPADAVRSALDALDVSVVVLSQGLDTPDRLALLQAAGFDTIGSADGYALWSRRKDPRS